MKSITSVVIAGAVAGLSALIMGCEWQSSDDGFNTSKGAGAIINFSGVYRAKNGGFLVGSNITQLVINQNGNAIEVWDNNNSYYRGSVGSPGVVGSPDSVSGVYPVGAVMVQSQMNFNGLDEATGKKVSFIGIIHAVAVADVKGTTTADTITHGNGAGTNIVNTTTVSAAVPGFSTINTTTKTNYVGGGESTSTSYTTTYTITDASAQYLMDGNWVENDGGIQASVSGIAPAVGGTFTSGIGVITPTQPTVYAAPK